MTVVIQLLQYTHQQYNSTASPKNYKNKKLPLLDPSLNDSFSLDLVCFHDACRTNVWTSSVLCSKKKRKKWYFRNPYYWPIDFRSIRISWLLLPALLRVYFKFMIRSRCLIPFRLVLVRRINDRFLTVINPYFCRWTTDDFRKIISPNFSNSQFLNRQ